MGTSPDAAMVRTLLFSVHWGFTLMKTYETQHTHTVVIGGDRQGFPSDTAWLAEFHLILDAHPRVGDAWRNRWDSLRLFTPSRYAGLPGFPFPGRGDAFLTKDQVADYLESYAQRFHLPVKNGVKVDSLSKEGQRFVTTAGDLRFESANVVVAMANYQLPRVPVFASELDSSIVQLHSHHYRNPAQLKEGGVPAAGVGNSGADIGMEVA
jgi:putative flavoprotein involved in K+ transport